MALITNGKSLYDTIQRWHGLTAEKIIGLEVLAIRESVVHDGCNLRWVSTEFMTAGALTKFQGLQYASLDKMHCSGRYGIV